MNIDWKIVGRIALEISCFVIAVLLGAIIVFLIASVEPLLLFLIPVSILFVGYCQDRYQKLKSKKLDRDYSNH